MIWEPASAGKLAVVVISHGLTVTPRAAMMYEHRLMVSHFGLYAAMSIAAATLLRIMLTATWAKEHAAEAKKMAAREEALWL